MEPLQVNNSTELSYKFSDRDVKGYLGERYVRDRLNQLHFSYECNPLNTILEWKQYQAKGADFKVEGNVEFEVKNTDSRIYPSWILRDWIPRFSYHNEARVACVPVGIKLSVQCMELLFNRNINICYLDSIRYLVPREANKLVKAKRSKSRLSYSNILTKHGTEPEQSRVSRPNTDKTSTLDVHSTDRNSHKTDNNQRHSGHFKLDCSTCLKRSRCETLNNVEYTKLKRPSIRSTQSSITDNFEHIPKVDMENLKSRRRTWLKQLGEVQNRQFRCLNRRIFLHLHRNYKLFVPESNSHELT